jgi:hypothetical protein
MLGLKPPHVLTMNAAEGKKVTNQASHLQHKSNFSASNKDKISRIWLQM